MTATTALTAQNTQGVRAIHHVPPDFVAEQIHAVFDDIGVDVVKIGMLASANTVGVVAHALEQHGHPPIVLDPVMVATSGALLLPKEAVANLREKLLSAATVLTPNISEARLLLEDAGLSVPNITSTYDLITMARQIQTLGPKYVLVKGGHFPLTEKGEMSTEQAHHHTVLNVLHDGEQATIFSADYTVSRNTHGTGCSLASAIASQMVLNPTGSMVQQIKSASSYVEMGIRTSIDAKLGRGSGAINHFHSANAQSSIKVTEFAREGS